MDTTLLILKICHIFGLVAWVGGLFYLANIMVYHRKAIENQTADNPEALGIFERIENGVYKKMCNPAMIVTWGAGILMLVLLGMDWFRSNLWMHHKLLLLILLTVFHLMAKKQTKYLQTGLYYMTTLQFKFFNAIPLLFLAAITILSVFQNTNPVIFPVVVVSMAMALLFLFVRIKKSKKLKTPQQNQPES